MKEMTLKELYECGLNYDTFIGQAPKDERLRIPKNYSRINFEGDVLEKIKTIDQKLYFLCVGEMWCPDCQLNLTVIKMMCEINTNLDMTLITKGRGQKYLASQLFIEEIKIPTIVILDKNFEKIGVYLEQPNVYKEKEKTDELELEYFKGKYLADTAKDILKEIYEG